MGKIHKHGTKYSHNIANNLYRFLLQREMDSGGEGYIWQPFHTVLDDISNSTEYKDLSNSKKTLVCTPQFLNYTILKINDRANESLAVLHDTLKDTAKYHKDIEFVNYRGTDINEFFKSRNIPIKWKADLFGLSKDTTPSELAVTASHMVAIEYLLSSDLDNIIVFEDDVVLDSNFVNIVSQCLTDLPLSYDLLADSTIFPDYAELATEEQTIDIGSRYICRSYLQNAHTGFMLYSRKGAQRIIDLYKEHGIICSIDTFLFWLGQRGDLESYTTFYSNKLLDRKDIYGTMVTNIRS
jgi:hypothetical protein